MDSVTPSINICVTSIQSISIVCRSSGIPLQLSEWLKPDPFSSSSGLGMRLVSYSFISVGPGDEGKFPTCYHRKKSIILSSTICYSDRNKGKVGKIPVVTKDI